MQKSTGKLLFLSVDEIYPHPDNPRKDLGDLSELAQSIKTKGIMQNLTVIKGTVGSNTDEGYTVIIGHRRLAAAKIAGLSEVPCVVVEMSPQEQIGTMLLENMQRTDLTLYEQAQGLQMMLDFGDSIETISEKSGLSQSTIRRRVKLLELDEEAFKESTTRGAPLLDYMELDKIESFDERTKLLKVIGTSEFRQRLKCAIANQEAEKLFNSRLEKVKSFATEITGTIDYKKYRRVASYFSWEQGAEIKILDNTSEKYYFTVSFKNIYVLKKVEKTTVTEDEDTVRQNDKKMELIAQIKAATKRAYELRHEFAETVSATTIKKHFDYIIAFWLWSQATNSAYYNEEDVVEILGIKPVEKDDEEIVLYSDVIVSVKKSPEKALWKMIRLSFGDNEHEGYYSKYGAVLYEQNEELNRYYDLLVLLGYELSEEEKQLRDGTFSAFSELEALNNG